ncbi:unnamed protein product [Malus baccata var. baccata]
MTAYEASSSSSFKSKLWNYDVFLSFSDEDTRKGFTGHLHDAIEDRGYKAYMDKDDLKRGEEIKEELYRAIEESRISIIVFSKKYADSSWCLDELVKIMECRSNWGDMKQNRDLVKAFQKHNKGISKVKDGKKHEAERERVKQWRKALTEAANLSGHHLQITDNRHEAKFIREIVDKIITDWLLSTNELDVAKYPIGIDSRIQGITNHLLRGVSNEVVMVGIWGMGGVGKTTAAKAIYNQIHHLFKFKSFLADVSNTTSKHSLVYLQKTLVSDILKEKFEISSVDGGIRLIKQQFRRRRVLVIMDNIDEVEQLNAIAGNHDWFGPKSRIIVTTRDEQLLHQVGVDKIYQLHEMSEAEALELFSWHAFSNSRPNEGYLELSRKIVSYCGGLPLALEVLGSFLIKRTIAEWESQLKKLKITPKGEIIKPLRISFEGLDDTENAIFLDISCFFIGWDKDYVTKVLDGCELSATIGISVLRQRCLVTFQRNELYMHDLLREMARVIISERFADHPERWSRLWNPQLVTEVLTDKSGTEEVEGLALHLSIQDFERHAFSTEAFANMKKLRLLQLINVQLIGEYKHVPTKLIWLCGRGFPLQSIPGDFFNLEKLVFLDMQGSRLVQVWEGSKSLQKLKIIDLSFSFFLIKSPDFSQLPNLEELILEGCDRLSEIHPSIGHLKRLALVNLTGCEMLSSLPGDFFKSKSVETLLLNGCLQFREMHEDLGEMISLRILEADDTAIRQVPPSIVGSKNLTRLSLQGVERLRLPYSLWGLNSLRELNLSQCNLDDDEIPKGLGSLISLQDLHLEENHLHILPSLSGLSKLETLRLNKCYKLCEICDLPTNLKILHAHGCPSLVKMPDFSKMSNMRELDVSDSLELREVPGLDKSLNSMTLIDMKKCTKLTADFTKNIVQKLRLLQLSNVQLNGEYKHFPKKLMWLSWSGCHLESIPDDFLNQEKLVILDMQWSRLVQVWEGYKSLQKLKIINLSHSTFLQKSLDFSQVPNLEELILEDCWRLSEIHRSIGHLKRLSLVNLTRCLELSSLPWEFYKSKSVETLLLNGCKKFREVHEDLGEMISLRLLEADDTAIRQVPPCIVGLKNLTHLSLQGVERLRLPHSLHGLNSLRELNISWCKLADDAIPKDLGTLISLQDLQLKGNDFHTLPSLSGLSKLETLNLSLDKSLNSMTLIDMKKCTKLTADFMKNILQGWTSCRFGGIFLHGNYVPDWFKFVNNGNKLFNHGIEEVEGLGLHLSIQDLDGYAFRFSTEAFVNMEKPRLLQLSNVQLNGEYKHIPKMLMGLSYCGWQLKSIPDDFLNQEKLVILDMQWSTLVQVWEGYKLILEDCISLSEIHPSIGHLERLSLVNLKRCNMLPRDFYKSKSAETLLLNWCSKFREVDEDIGEMILLRILEADCTAIRKVPLSIVGLKNLTRLSLQGVKRLHLSHSLHGLNSLWQLNLSWCDLADDAIPMYLGTLISFQCRALETMPDFSEMSNIRELDVNDSLKLTKVTGLDKSLNSMTRIDMVRCTNLTADFTTNILHVSPSLIAFLSDGLLADLVAFSSMGIMFLIGFWFEFASEGTLISFDIPPCDGRNFEGLTLFCLYTSCNRTGPPPRLAITVIKNTKCIKLQACIVKEDWNRIFYKPEPYYIWQGQLLNDKFNLQGGDRVEIVNRTGVNLVWDKPIVVLG